MPFCSKCGAQNEETAKFCASCGASLNTNNNDSLGNFKQKFEGFNNTANSTDEFDAKDIENNKVMGVLAYIGLLVLVPILAAKDSKFAKFHANQGLILLITEVILSFAVNVVFGIMSAILGFLHLGFLAVLFTALANLAVSVVCIVYIVIGIVNAANGTAKELPLIGKYRIIKY